MRYRYCIFVLFFLVHESLSLFFILGEREQRCLYDDYQDDITVTFDFNATVRRTSAPIGMSITILGPNKEVILRKDYGSKSSVNFRTNEPGEYALCIGSNSTKWAMYATETIMVHFQLETDSKRDDEDEHHDENEKGPNAKTKKLFDIHGNEPGSRPDEEGEEGGDDENETPLTELGDRIHHVRKSVKWIQNMQKTQRLVEEKFRVIAETTNSRVIMLAILQLIILLSTAWWQMNSLKSFFIAKKLV